MGMKLADWARKEGIAYLTAYRWFKAGKLPLPAIQTATGTILVQELPLYTNATALYGRRGAVKRAKKAMAVML